MSLKKQFNNVYYKILENLPDELSMPIVVIDKKPYTWETVKTEVDKNTDLGKRCLDTLDRLDII